MMGKNKLAEFLQPCQSQWWIMINYTATPAGTSLRENETWFLRLIAELRFRWERIKQTSSQPLNSCCSSPISRVTWNAEPGFAQNVGFKDIVSLCGTNVDNRQNIPLILNKCTVCAVRGRVIFQILQWWCDRPLPGPIRLHKSHSVKGW